MYVGLLGGTFNPVHSGHVRLAIEVRELVLPDARCPGAGRHGQVDRVDLVPCASPAHKAHDNMLPFSLRVAMARAAVGGVEGVFVNPLEGERAGPSYTHDTLTAYHERAPEDRLLFVLGDDAFRTLPTWHRGLELPRQCDMLIIPRAGMDAQQFADVVREFWPGAACTVEPQGCRADVAATTARGGRVFWRPLPRLDISSSTLRQRWLDGDDLTCLVPEAALGILREHRDTVTACWRRRR